MFAAARLISVLKSDLFGRFTDRLFERQMRRAAGRIAARSGSLFHVG